MKYVYIVNYKSARYYRKNDDKEREEKEVSELKAHKVFEEETLAVQYMEKVWQNKKEQFPKDKTNMDITERTIEEDVEGIVSIKIYVRFPFTWEGYKDCYGWIDFEMKRRAIDSVVPEDIDDDLFEAFNG